MIRISLTIRMSLHVPAGLKGRRKVMQSLKSRLQQHNISALDTSDSYAGEGTLEGVAITSSEAKAHLLMQSVERILSTLEHECSYDLFWEILAGC